MTKADRIRHLLTTTQMSVSAIAHEVGTYVSHVCSVRDQMEPMVEKLSTDYLKTAIERNKSVRIRKWLVSNCDYGELKMDFEDSEVCDIRLLQDGSIMLAFRGFIIEPQRYEQWMLDYVFDNLIDLIKHIFANIDCEIVQYGPQYGQTNITIKDLVL